MHRTAPPHNFHTDLIVKASGITEESSYFRVTFTASSGLGVQALSTPSDHKDSVSVNYDKHHSVPSQQLAPVVSWFEHVLRVNVSTFSAAYVWGYTMVALQILALILLTLEPFSAQEVIEHPDFTVVGLVNYRNRSMPQYKNYNNTIRFISDNIHQHRGYGSVMLLAFAGSYVLFACVFMSPGVMVVIGICIIFSAAGGLGVVLFHDGQYHTHHIASAAVFISGGLIAHALVAQTLHRRIQDLIFIGTPALFALLFLSFYTHCHSKSHGNRNDPKYINLWWYAGIFEYMLYITMTALNLMIPERLIRSASMQFAKLLPDILRAYVAHHSENVKPAA